MRTRIFPLVLLLSLLVTSAPALASAFRPAAATRPGLTLLSASAEGVTISLATPHFETRANEQAGDHYLQLTVPGYDRAREPGAPRLPQVSTLVGVPPGAQVQLEVLSTDTQSQQIATPLEPASAPAPLDEALQPGAWHSPAPGVSYQADRYAPARPAAIVEDAWIRDQRVVRLVLYPFQYNPARGEVLWHRHLQVRVHFQGGTLQGLDECGPGCGAPGSFNTLLAGNMINAHQASAWRRPTAGFPQLEPAALTAGLTDAETRYKIVLDQDGLYRLSYSDLLAAGVEVGAGGANPQNFQLTSQGETVAIHVEGEADGVFHPGDSLLFYGEKFRGDRLAAFYADSMEDWTWLCSTVCDLAGIFEKYTDENVYWLTVESAPGLRMQAESGVPGAAPVPGYYTTTLRLEEEHAWFSYHFTSEDTWFWERLAPDLLPVSRTYTATLSALATAALTATVRAEVVAESLNNHHTQFFLNGDSQPLDDATWSGRTKHDFETQIPHNQLVEGENELRLESLLVNQNLFFNWFELTFGREFLAEGDQLSFSYDVPGTWQFQVEGLDSAAVHALDITNPLTPTLLLTPTVTDAGGTYTVAFEDGVSGPQNYLVAGAPAELSPVSIEAYTPEDFLGTSGADYVLISHPAMITETQRLADYRATRGLSTRVVSVMELYDQFNFGIYHPIAVKNFLAFTFANWATPPAYVALVGGGHWNLKSIPDYETDPIYMAPNLAFVDPWQGEVDSANLLATIVGDDILPDLFIARLPANSPVELATMIDKVIAYESTPFRPWQRNHVFVTDDSPDPAGAGNFIAFAQGVIADYLSPDPSVTVDRVYLNDHSISTITQVLLDTLNMNGASLVSYIGHGSLNFWAHNILTNDDVADFQNGAQLPIVLSMTCLDGYWIYPGRPSLISTLLGTPDKGAVATFSATGLGVATGHDYLHRGFYEALFALDEWQLGPAAQNAKLNLFTNGSSNDLIHTFTVFGDPALKVHGLYAFLPAIKRQ